MNLKKAYLLTSILSANCLLLLPASSSAQAPKYSNEFLSIGVGARARHGQCAGGNRW